MMMTPRVSICVPLFNKAGMVERCVRTLLRVPVEGMEVVVFDNGSDDGSSEIVARMAAGDARLRHVRLEHTIMVQESWRMALLHGRGELLKLHSADDELHPDFWERMLPPLEDPAVEFTMCAEAIEVAESSVHAEKMQRVFEWINDTCRQLLTMSEPALRERLLAVRCAGMNNLGNLYKVVVRRSCLPLERWRMVTPAYPMPTSYPDWDFLLRLVLNHRGHFVDEVLSRYWITPESPIARRKGNPALQIADEHQRLLMVVTVLGDPTLARLRSAMSQAELQSLLEEAVRRLTQVTNLAGGVAAQGR